MNTADASPYDARTLEQLGLSPDAAIEGLERLDIDAHQLGALVSRTASMTGVHLALVRAPDGGLRLSITHGLGDALAARVLANAAEAAVDLTSADASLDLDLDALRCARITTSEGDSLLVAATRRDGALALTLAFDASDLGALPPAVTFAPDVLAWLDDIDDPWLAEHIRDALAEDSTPWAIAAATGAFGRLRDEPPSRKRAVVEALMRGERDELAHRAWGWARGLTDAHHALLASAALHACDACHDALDALEDLIAPEDPGWRADALRAHHLRSDLASVASVLHQRRGAPDALRGALGDLDERAQRFFFSLPMLTELAEDPRLQREAQLDPDTWWAAPVLDADHAPLQSARSERARDTPPPPLASRRLLQRLTLAQRQRATWRPRFAAAALRGDTSAPPQPHHFTAHFWSFEGQAWEVELSMPDAPDSPEPALLRAFDVPERYTQVVLMGIARALSPQRDAHFTLAELRRASEDHPQDAPALVLLSDTPDAPPAVGLAEAHADDQP